jgi:hypothetical protein
MAAAPARRGSHSITSLAVARTLSGTVRPSILAVWALMTGSNLLPAARSRMRVRGETELFPGRRIKLPCLSVGS